MEFEIDNDDLKRIEKMSQELPKELDYIVRNALKKSITFARKKDVETIKAIYSINPKDIKLRTSSNSKEAILKASRKRIGVSKFAISQRKPSKNIDFMKSAIKKSSVKRWSTMFWANYKSGTPTLMIRNGKERYKISRAKTLSLKSMGIKLDTNLVEREIADEIFTKELKKGLKEYGY
ncbi:MAG: hypothetical protein CR959_01350 [Fusobacteriales bacterium]|nr:MAG: hypothetical protein CR959_01350 [Fusobacteriales bacterium]